MSIPPTVIDESQEGRKPFRSSEPAAPEPTYQVGGRRNATQQQRHQSGGNIPLHPLREIPPSRPTSFRDVEMTRTEESQTNNDHIRSDPHKTQPGPVPAMSYTANGINEARIHPQQRSEDGSYCTNCGRSTKSCLASTGRCAGTVACGAAKCAGYTALGVGGAALVAGACAYGVADCATCGLVSGVANAATNLVCCPVRTAAACCCSDALALGKRGWSPYKAANRRCTHCRAHLLQRARSGVQVLVKRTNGRGY